MGSSCSLLPGASTELGASLGAHSVLKTHVHEYGIYAGVPAKKVGTKKQFNSEILDLLMKNGVAHSID